MEESRGSRTTRAASHAAAERTNTLDKSRAAGKADTPAPAVKTLEQPAAGLLFPSETDASLTPFFWPDEKLETLTPERMFQLAHAPADAPIKSVKLGTFFRPATREDDWHNDDEKAQVARSQELLDTIKNALKEVRVFRVAEIKIDVYIIGQTDGG